MATLEVNINGRGAVTGARQVTRSLDDIRAKSSQTSGALQKQTAATKQLSTATSALVRLAAPIAAAFAAGNIIKQANAYQTLTNQLRIVTSSEEELTSAQTKLFEIAQRTAQPIEATTQLFSRASIAAKELGASQAELFKLTEITGNALRLQGSGAAEASGALRQLSQSFSSGIVRAEEFNSILEGAFPLAQAAARGIDEAGGSVGKLRQLVVAGKVTSQDFFEAILKGGESIADQLSGNTVTISQAFTKVQNSFLKFVGTLTEASGFSSSFAGTLESVSTGLDTLTRALTGTLQPTDEVNAGLQVFISSLLIAGRIAVTLGKSLTTAIVTPFKAVGNTIGGVAAAIAAFFRGDFAEAATTFSSAFTDSVTIVQNDARSLRDTLISDTSDTIEKVVELWDTGSRNVIEAAEAANDIEVAPKIDPAAAANVKKLNDELNKLAETVRSNIQTPLQAFQAEVDNLDRLLVASKITQTEYNLAVTQAARAYVDATPAGMQYNEMLAEGQRIFEATRTPAEQYGVTVGRLGELLQGGFISQETFNRSVEDAQQKLKDATTESGALSEFLEQTSIQAARNIQSAFADFLFDPFDQGLKGLVSNFADALRRMAAEALSQQILQGIFGAATGGAAGGGAGGLAGIFQGIFRQGGGGLAAGQPAMVGEQGKAEMFVPRDAGQVVSNRELRAGAAGMAAPEVNVPVNIVNVTDPAAIPAGIESAQGQKAVLNVIQSNPDSIKRALS